VTNTENVFFEQNTNLIFTEISSSNLNLISDSRIASPERSNNFG